MKINKDNLHRGVKMALDSGEAISVDEAEKLFQTYQICIEYGSDIAESPTLQALLLTAVNTGRRCCLGGVSVVGNPDILMKIPWRQCKTLGDAILDLEGKLTKSVIPNVPRIVIGDVDNCTDLGTFAVRATFNGWSAGVVPLQDQSRLPEQQECILAGVLAGSLAISEAFQSLRGNELAGYRDVGLSLWHLGGNVNWLSAEPGPLFEILPTNLWLIGLGHLGQAYLWTLGFLPFPNPKDVNLVLQDFDVITKANDSTSPLTTAQMIGQKKTRALAYWCEQRGFTTNIIERHFSSDFVVSANEPQVALCGVDNVLARAALEDVGFKWILEAGLGNGPKEYLGFQIHTFPSTQKASKLWNNSFEGLNQLNLNLPAYQDLARQGIDECGIVQIADRTVGAPFVGTAISALLFAELVRMLMGENRHEFIDGSLGSLNNMHTIKWAGYSPQFNPGIVVTNHTI